MVSFPRGPMSLISNLLVTLDCLDIGVSLDCPQCHTGQGQRSRSKPQAPSFWNQKISAWALKQGGEPRFQAFCFSTPGVSLLCLMGPNVLLLSVLWSGSHLFFSNTLFLSYHWPWRPGALSILDMFPHILAQMIWATLFCLRLYYILCSVRYVDIGKPLYCDGPNKVPVTDSSQLCPVSPVPVWPLITKDHKRVAHLRRKAQILLEFRQHSFDNGLVSGRRKTMESFTLLICLKVTVSDCWHLNVVVSPISVSWTAWNLILKVLLGAEW